VNLGDHGTGSSRQGKRLHRYGGVDLGDRGAASKDRSWSRGTGSSRLDPSCRIWVIAHRDVCDTVRQRRGKYGPPDICNNIVRVKI
jgi:hypothetical protein